MGRLTTRPRRGQSYTDWRDEWHDVFVGTLDPFVCANMAGHAWPIGYKYTVGAQQRPVIMGIGRLNHHHTAYATYVEDWARITYVVTSYGTPIAWRLDDGTWRVPDVRYSVTTARHQSLARMALDSIGQAQAYARGEAAR